MPAIDVQTAVALGASVWDAAGSDSETSATLAWTPVSSAALSPAGGSGLVGTVIAVGGEA